MKSEYQKLNSSKNRCSLSFDRCELSFKNNVLSKKKIELLKFLNNSVSFRKIFRIEIQNLKFGTSVTIKKNSFIRLFSSSE